MTNRLDYNGFEEAWEFWETVYRNFAWVMSSLGCTQDAIAYVQQAIDVKMRVGREPSWFDHWDLGRMKATLALRRNDEDEIRDAQDEIRKALRLSAFVLCYFG